MINLMKPALKIAGVIIFVMLIVIIVLIFSLKIGEPNRESNEGFTFTIKGNVTIANKELDNLTKPDFVSIFPSVSYFNNLCYHSRLTDRPANISWSGNEGTYIITLTLPVEQEIIVTPGCEGCQHKRLIVSPNQRVYYVNLEWDTSSCSISKENFNDSQKALDRATYLLDDASRDLDNYNFEKSVTESIKKTIQDGRGHVSDGRNPNSESLYHGMYSILDAWMAFNEIDLENLQECLQKVNQEIEIHNDSCYSIPFDAYETYESVNTTFISASEVIQNIGARQYGPNDLNYIKDDINFVTENERDTISLAKQQCDNSLKQVTNSFNFQKSYCVRKKVTITVINWSIVFISFIFGGIFGIYLGKFGERW